MDTFHKKAYAKINLGLDVLRKRPDGYHDVCMIMQTVDLYDELTFTKSDQSGIHLIIQGRPDLSPGEDNLIVRAAKALFERCHIEAGVDIVLQKNIPIAAGMAGGSTDAAATLHGINELFSLGLTLEELKEIGVKLGADIPYCLMGGCALSEGIGEVLTPLCMPPEAYLVIAKPEVSVSTKYVYEHLNLPSLQKHPDIVGMRKAIEAGDLNGICERMDNVLATVTEGKYQEIGHLKTKMLECGALNALMSGSGPTVFGVFDTKEKAEYCFFEVQKTGLANQLFVSRFHDSKN